MSLLRSLFGPSKEEIWRALANEIDAEYVDGGFWKGDKVQAQYGDWTVTLDTYTESSGKNSTTYTRIRAPYVNRDGLRFEVYRAGLFSGMGRALGMQDIEIGEPAFDEAFVLKGNNEAQVRRLFKNPLIRQLLEAQPAVHLEIWDDEGWFGPSFPQGVDELRFRVVGTIRDVEQLKQLFMLFAEVLNTLCHIGSAYEDDPGLDL